jgi:hypothetical protein
MDKIRFFITEYTDGNLKIEPKHMHYTFRDDLNADDFAPAELFQKMREISAICKRENIIPVFIYNA